MLDMEKGVILNKTTSEEITFKALSPLMQKISNESWVINYIKKYGDIST